jgi:glycerate kinase
MRIVVAMDSFKGTLSAGEACAAVAAGVRSGLAESGHSRAEILQRPMADGGEGTLEILQDRLGGALQVHTATGPLPDRFVLAPWLEVPEQGLAVVEMAAASGLTLLDPAERDPLRTTTRGVGELIRNALDHGARRLLLGLGGSATVDGGTGAARALGWRFLDGNGVDVPEGGEGLERIRSAVSPPGGAVPLPPLGRLRALVDVQNPLVGPRGAAPIFGPQKGADSGAVERLESGLANLAEVILSDLGLDVASIPGGGAAGGFGAGAVAFMGAELVSGVDEIANLVGLDEALEGADWVITGEGRLDSQSLDGKVVSGVVARAQRQGCRVAVLAGAVALDRGALEHGGIQLALGVAGEDSDVSLPGPVEARHQLRGAALRLSFALAELGPH